MMVVAYVVIVMDVTVNVSGAVVVTTSVPSETSVKPLTTLGGIVAVVHTRINLPKPT